ncbi:hypothetical protein CC79DRAFT_1331308 [Sarocladium strictum]
MTIAERVVSADPPRTSLYTLRLTTGAATWDHHHRCRYIQTPRQHTHSISSRTALHFPIVIPLFNEGLESRGSKLDTKVLSSLLFSFLLVTACPCNVPWGAPTHRGVSEENDGDRVEL